MYVYTIVDIRSGKGYTGRSELPPDDLLNSRYYMKTNDLPVYEIIRRQGVDWFKLTVLGEGEELYKSTLAKIHDYNPAAEYVYVPPRKIPNISIALKKYYENNPSPFKGKTHPNLHYWKGKKKPNNQFAWIITYRDSRGEEVTEVIDNLALWTKSMGLPLSKIKWRVQHYRDESKKPAFPYGPVMNIKRVSAPKHVKPSKGRKIYPSSSEEDT